LSYEDDDNTSDEWDNDGGIGWFAILMIIVSVLGVAVLVIWLVYPDLFKSEDDELDEEEEEEEEENED
jgi:Tfp pilus assembly protein PilO